MKTALLAACAAAALLQLAACSSTDGETPPTEAAPPGAATTSPAAPAESAPVATPKAAQVVYAIPQAMSDYVLVSASADGRVKFWFFNDGISPDYPWSAADKAATKDAFDKVPALPVGAVLAIPASRMTRAQSNIQTRIADLPHGTCADCTTPKCPVDPATLTCHVGLGDAPQEDGRDLTYWGGNTAGGLVRIASSHRTATSLEVWGYLEKIEGAFDALSVSSDDAPPATTSAGDAGADASPPAPSSAGFVKLTEGLHYDGSGKVLEGLTGGPVTVTLTHGKFDFDPLIRTYLKMKGGTVEDARVEVKGDLSLDAQLTVSIAKSVSTSFKQDYSATLYEFESPLPPIVVGGVPVPESVKVKVVANCLVEASAEASVAVASTFHQSVTVGGRYANGAFKTSFAAPPFALTASKTFAGKARTSATCSLDARLSLLVYGSIGPYVGLTAGTGFDASLATGTGLSWKLEGRVSGHMGVEPDVKIPGLGPLLNALPLPKDTEIFSTSAVLSSGTIP